MMPSPRFDRRFAARFLAVLACFAAFAAVAAGFGIPARTVSDKADLDAALIEMIESPAAFVLNVMVPHQEHVLPMIPSGMTVKDMIKA